MNLFRVHAVCFAHLSTYFVYMIFWTSFFQVDRAEARPEYAIRYANNRCTACHYSPAGGGPKNESGKYFGAFGYPSNSWIRTQGIVGVEAKALYYRAEKSSTTRGGLGIMNGDVWAAIPVQELSSDSTEIRLIIEQNLGGFGAGPRQWYARFMNQDDTQTSLLPQYYTAGRFVVPFGLMTDEHRTFTRIASGTSWNNAFDTGAMASANPVESIHYDVAAVNGVKNNGTLPSTAMADVWGGVINVRWLPTRVPFALGASASVYSASPTQPSAEAKSIYGLLSMHRLTKNWLPVTLSAEWVQARGWNTGPALSAPPFISQSDYSTAVATATSQSIYGLLDIALTERTSLQYKFDQLKMNQDFPADAYVRHGVGLKTWFGNGMWAILRYDFSKAGRVGETNNTGTGGMSAAWALLSFSI